MPAPFSRRPLKEPGLLQKVFGRPVPENSVIALNNLLASARDVADIDEDDVRRAVAPYRTDPRIRYGRELEDLYRAYLEQCLADRRLEEGEIERLAHLKRLLAVPDAHAKTIHTLAARHVYQASVEEAMTDGRISGDEAEFLRRLETEFAIPAELARSIREEAAQEVLDHAIEAAVSDSFLTPEEEDELQVISGHLGVPLPADKTTREALRRGRLYWLITHGEIPTIDAEINLQGGERCYAVREASWYEMRTVTRSVRYGGPTARVRIMKGVYWRIGEIGVQRVSEDVMRLIDEGRVFLTSKRLIFMGEQRNTSIRLDRILDFEPHSNGVTIQKDAGRSPFFEFSADVDLFCLILARALRVAG